jgi:hypothetical protein
VACRASASTTTCARSFARRERDKVFWNRRFLHLRGHYGFHTTACTPAAPREKGSVEAQVRYLKAASGRRAASAICVSSTAATPIGAPCLQPAHACTGRFRVEERLAEAHTADQAVRRTLSKTAASAP